VLEGRGSGHEQSSELLKDALLLHPYVLAGIVSKTPIQVRAMLGRAVSLLSSETKCRAGKISRTPILVGSHDAGLVGVEPQQPQSCCMAFLVFHDPLR